MTPQKQAVKKQNAAPLHEMDFEQELVYGEKTYNKKVGKWWLGQAANKAHQHAYKHIAEHLKAFLKSRKIKPGVVADYACGGGGLLWRLGRQFKRARIVGIDGSSTMLKIADQVLLHRCNGEAERFELIESDLPNFEIELKADLIVFCFPNICPRSDDQPYYDEHGAMHKTDRKAAGWLAKAREEDPETETCFEKPRKVKTDLLDAKVISRNLHALLNPGGICARIEYANAHHDELSELVQQRCLFGMGALVEPVGGTRPEQIFELLESTYHISDVIEDVYHQSKEEEQTEGGYHINFLRAL